MAKYVKLGSKASVFHDPTTNTKVLPGQVVEVKGVSKFSKKIIAAISGGHLENATQEEYLKYKGGVKVNSNNDNSNWVEEWDDFDEESLKGLTNAKLVELANHLETELDDKELGKLNKQELVEEILSLVEEE